MEKQKGERKKKKKKKAWQLHKYKRQKMGSVTHAHVFLIRAYSDRTKEELRQRCLPSSANFQWMLERCPHLQEGTDPTQKKGQTTRKTRIPILQLYQPFAVVRMLTCIPVPGRSTSVVRTQLAAIFQFFTKQTSVIFLRVCTLLPSVLKLIKQNQTYQRKNKLCHWRKQSLFC